jgi:hypothetical protein
MSNITPSSSSEGVSSSYPINEIPEEPVSAGQVSQTSSPKDTKETKQEIKEILHEIDHLINKLDKHPEEALHIMRRIMKLLMELIPLMQQIGVALAEKMNLSTKMQDLYTRLIAEIPVYKKGVPVFDPNNSENDDRLRNEANQRLGIIADRLRAQRDKWMAVGKKDTADITQISDFEKLLTEDLREFIRLPLDICSKIFR